MEPTPEEQGELLTAGTVKALADWCDFQPDLLKAFLAASGATEVTKFRLFSRMSEQEFQAIIDKTKIEEDMLNPVLRSQIGLFWDTSRLLCKVMPCAAERAMLTQKALDLEIEKARAATAWARRDKNY